MSDSSQITLGIGTPSSPERMTLLGLYPSPVYTDDEKLRMSGQFSELGLIIHDPDVVLVGVVDTAPTSNDSCVALDWSKTYGTLSDGLPGMTVWIGTNAGTFDKGVVRLRETPTADTIKIGEASEIYWQAGDYITVVREFAIWRRDIRVVDENTFYMDWDVAYSNQHASPDPIVNMGTDVIVDVQDGEVIVDFDSSGSSVIVGSIASHLWDALGNSSEADMNTATPEIGYDTAGSHMVSCTVTTAAGKTHTGYRFAHAIDDANPGIQDFEVTQLEGSFDSGGWSAEIIVHAPVSVPDRARVIIFAKDWYQGIAGSLDTNLVFVGWIIGRTVSIDPETNYTTFKVAGPQYWIKLIKGFPAGVEDTDFADNGGGAPNRWTEMEDLTPAKGLWHFLHWRCTATNCIDITLPTDTRQLARSSTPTGTLWDQLVTLSTQVNLSVPCCDKFGRLFVVPQQQYVPLDERDAIEVLRTLTNEDYSDITIDRRIIPGLYYAEVSGVWYDDDASGPMGAKAPGSTPRHMGEGEQIFTEIVMGTQEEAIELAGLVLGSKADDPEYVSVTIEQLDRRFDITPHSYVKLTLPLDETDQQIEYDEKRLIVRSVRFVHGNSIGFHHAELDLESEGIQLPAVKMTFPGEGDPPVEPPVVPPKPPPEDPGDPPIIDDVDPGGTDAVVATTSDVRTTADLDEASPTWLSEL